MIFQSFKFISSWLGLYDKPILKDQKTEIRKPTYTNFHSGSLNNRRWNYTENQRFSAYNKFSSIFFSKLTILHARTVHIQHAARAVQCAPSVTWLFASSSWLGISALMIESTQLAVIFSSDQTKICACGKLHFHHLTA